MGLIPNVSTEKLKMRVYNVEDVITRMGDSSKFGSAM